MAISAEQLNVILTAKDREFTRAMERSQRQVARFARKSQQDLSKTGAAFVALKRAVMPLAAALGARALVNGLTNVVAAMDDIGKTADRIGITTDALQELRAVAESAGVEQGALDSSIEKLGKGLAEAAMGIGTAKYALDELNLSANDLMAMGLDGAMAEIADAVNDVSDPMQRTALATQLFGRSGAPMLNLLAEGSDGMARMRQEARDLGIVMDEGLIRGAEEAQTKLDLMKRVISAELSEALIHLAPLLVGAATGIANLASGVGSFVDAIAGLFDSETDLEKAMSLAETAIDNSTLAMGDQIRQSALLEARTSSGNVMTLEAARVNLASVKARLEDVAAMTTQAEQEARRVLGVEENLAAIANARAAFLQAQANIPEQDLLDQEQYGDRFTETPAMSLASELESMLQGLLVKQEEINAALAEMEFLSPEQEAAQEQIVANIARLEKGIIEAEDGLISFNGEVTTGVELTDRLGEGAEGVTLANAEASSRRLSSSLRGNVLLAAQLSAIGGGGTAPSSDAIFDPRSNQYDPAAQTLSNALQAALDAQAERQQLLAELRGSFEETGEAAELSAGGAGAAAREATEDYIGLSDAVVSSQDALSSVMSTMESSMESAFMSMIDGTKSAEDAFKAMSAEIIKELYRVLVVKQITGFIAGAIGGFFNMNQVSGPAMPLGTGSIVPPIRPMASGGVASAGNAYMTGEHGRELFVPQVNGRILSAAQTRNATSGGGGVSVVQNINISTGVAQTVRTEIKTLMPQIADAAKSAVVDAKLRGGSYGRAFG